MTETKNRERTPLNEYMVKIINGTRYKVYSIYVGDRDFQHLYKNLVIEKAVRQQNGHCNDAGEGKINLILVKDLSRFGRDYIETGRYIDVILPSLGCRFIALNDGVDTINKDNGMLLDFKNVMNDFYARDTGSKIKSVRQSACKTGKYIGCYAPYGYVKDPQDSHRFMIDETAAAVVREIFSFRCQGPGFRRIAQKLNESGILLPREYYYQSIGRVNPHRQNKMWNDVTIRKLVRNEVYIGHMV